MTVKDLKEGMNCTIISTRKDKKLESGTTIRRVDKNVILVDAVYYKGSLVNLSSTSNHLMIDINSHEPQIFQYIYPQIYRTGGKTYYRIDLKNKISTKFNRRHNTRLSIGKSIHVHADNGTDSYSCTLKDISAVGFALEFTKGSLPPECNNAKSFQCTYSDANKETRLRITLDLDGAVKRKVDLPNGKVLFGCQMAYSYSVDKYVAQRINAKRG